jgi:hypothetical protein
MACIECKKWVSDSDFMARMGYARCEAAPAGHYRHGLAKHEVECIKKTKTDEVTIEKRRKYFDKITTKEKQNEPDNATKEQPATIGRMAGRAARNATLYGTREPKDA